jgi:hypothetical protein
MMTVPVLSTEHLREETANAHLSASENEFHGLIAALMPDGFQVYADESIGLTPDLDDERVVSEVPADLVEVIRWAHRHDFDWVRFNHGGDLVADLPTYPWS